jgi:autotransporter-associated beta strand protein
MPASLPVAAGRAACSLCVPIVALVLSCVATPHLGAAPPPGYYLVWGDEFEASSLDGTKWWTWSGANRDAINVANAVTVQGGYLTIKTYTTNNTHYTAIISSDGKFRYRYGYLEASIQFSTTPGMWSAFWLQSPNEGQYIGDPSASGAEIDICEHRKTDGSGVDISSFVQTTVHWDGYGTDHKQVHGGNVGSGLGAGFHTYGLLWDTTNYSFIIDGAQAWGTNAGHSDRTEIILLSSEVKDAYWAGVVPPGGYGNFLTSTTRMVLDYVRYYAPTTTVYWTGASSADWGSIGNWLQGRAPNAGDDVVFSYLSKGNFSTSLGVNTSVGSLSIQEAGPVSVNNRTLTVTSGGIDMLSAVNDAMINSALVLGAGQTWRIASGRTLTVNGVMSGTGNLTLGSRGTVVLAATNTHSGTITISNGTLLVTGITGTNTVTVAGGTLAGSGRLAGPVIVNGGGTLTPGIALGTLTISNRLILQPGALTSIDINKTAGTSDEVPGLTSVAFSGTLVVNNQAGTLAPRDAFKLFDAGSYSGSFARINPATPGADLSWDTSTLTTDGTLRVMSTVRPNLAAQLNRTQVDLSWPVDHIGWRLQAQTNEPGLGLTTNWVAVPASVGTNRVLLAVNPGVGSVFFRLASPPVFTPQFGKGNLIVLLVGNGTIGDAGAPGVLNEYLPSGGAPLSQTPLPGSGSNALVFGPSAYGGDLALSADGQLLVLEGYNVPAGSYAGGSIDSSSTSGTSAVLRAVGSVNSAGVFALNATTTRFSGSTIRSAVSDGWGNFWAGGGSGGIAYLGTNSVPSTVSTISASTRSLGMFNGNLCFTETGLGIGVMGFAGAPTSAATPTMLVSTAGLGSGNSSPKGFVLSPPRTIAYVADNRSAASGGGIQRFDWNGAVWVHAYTLGCTLTSSKQVWNLTADFSGPNPVLYAITGESTANHLVSVADTGPGSVYSILATAPSGSAFRGVAFAPVQQAH